ncbi:MAG TPA: stage II sporulation protein M [Armatimonadota bacterium]|nr:stage II sporulation protein M [Armatimonadota bacterium]
MDRENDDRSIEQFEQMLRSIESKGLRSLSSAEVLAFGHLYRRAASALSTARSRGVHDAQIEYLNQLVSRAYGHIYVAESKGWPSVRNFFRKEFPQTFRRNLPFIAAAFVISIGAAFFAFGVVRHDPGKADVVLGPGTSDIIDSIAERHTGEKNWMPEEMRPVMSSFIMINNIRVAALAFSTGILGGLLTFAILFYNGLMLGVLGAAVTARGPDIALSFWGFVAPHGVIELTAIFISGGAGLMLGWALLSPGEYTRGVALKLAGREAFKLILGVASMLVVAGIIEGFFSPAVLPEELKLVVAAMLSVCLFSYLFLAGKEQPSAAGRQR